MDSLPWGLSMRIDKASAALGFLTGFYCSGVKTEAVEPMQGLKSFQEHPGKTGTIKKSLCARIPFCWFGRGG